MIEDDEIKTARAFLCRCHRTSREAMSSTVLMGIIARWAGAYCSNASVIDAAISLGFAVAPCRAPSNVAMIGIAKRDVEAIRAAVTKREVEALRAALTSAA
jgi:hypothetical protein